MRSNAEYLQSLDNLHSKILNSKFAEEVTSDEIDALVKAKDYFRDYYIYTVKQGDSMYRLHKMFNSPLSVLEFSREVIKINGNSIIVGTELKIPKYFCRGGEIH